MCFAIPGKVIEISDGKFVVDYGEVKRVLEMSLIPVSLGDFVIVSNKMIVTKIDKERAIKFLELMKK